MRCIIKPRRSNVPRTVPTLCLYQFVADGKLMKKKKKTHYLYTAEQTIIFSELRLSGIYPEPSVYILYIGCRRVLRRMVNCKRARKRRAKRVRRPRLQSTDLTARVLCKGFSLGCFESKPPRRRAQ